MTVAASARASRSSADKTGKNDSERAILPDVLCSKGQMWLWTDEVLAASHEAAAGDLNEGRVQIVRRGESAGKTSSAPLLGELSR